MNRVRIRTPEDCRDAEAGSSERLESAEGFEVDTIDITGGLGKRASDESVIESEAAPTGHDS